MIIKNSTFEEMSETILKKDAQIVIFGTGVVGTVTTLAILEQLGLLDRIAYFVDSNREKWNQKIGVGDRKIKILSPSVFDEDELQKRILLLAFSRFSEVLEKLKNKYKNKPMICYIIAMMCITNFPVCKDNLVIKRYNDIRIPKRINYMWLGRTQIPEQLQKCLDSWKKYCPDYEIVCWNEENYDISKNRYMKQAHERKMYGFVPDYARLDILYHYGGIYLDTDVELTKNLDDLLYQDGFCCVEKWQTVNLGGGSGAVPGNSIIGKMLEYRENMEFISCDGNVNTNTCGFYDTKVLQKLGYILNGTVQYIDDMTVYPSEFFHPFDYASGRTRMSVNTHGIHHFNGGWLDEKTANATRETVEKFEEIYKEAQMNNKLN